MSQDYRLNNILRYWIKKNGYRMPSTEQIKSICLNILNAGDDKNPFFNCKDFEIRRYDNYLEIMKPLKKHNPSEIYKWKFNENLIIPNLSPWIISSFSFTSQTILLAISPAI